jgi:putative transposase
MVSPHARRQQVEFARRRGLSCRLACALLRVARSGLRYESKRRRRDAPVQQRMRELSAQYLWRSAGLQLPRRRRRRRVASSRPRPLPATGPNQVWAYDFVFDHCANGQRLKCLTVVDEWTREALAIDVAPSLRSGRVIDVLARLVSVHGAPRYLRSDHPHTPA